MKKLVLISGLLFAATLWASAQTATPGVDQRQRNQAHRIREGAQSGELTRTETRRMVRQQRHINRQKKAAEADGVLTPQERRQLHREQNRTNRRIYRQKHDVQDRN